jgi:hypothetical protein
MKLLILCALGSTLVGARPKDAFAGKWRLNASKSIFKVNSDAYKAGFRSYTPTPDGERVEWTMVDNTGKESSGAYSVRCIRNQCSSDVVRWQQIDQRMVRGEVIEHGAVTRRYIRTVSVDGQVLTITFYKLNENTPASVQVWERQ